MKLNDSSEQYLKDLVKVSIPPKKLIDQLWRKVKSGDKHAKIKLIEIYLRLVIPIAKKYYRATRTIVDFLDLVEEGNIGLIRAIEKYNPRKKVHFTTYATYWIEQHIRRAIEQQTKTIRIPPHMWDNLKKWLKEREKLYTQLGRYPTTAEIARKFHLSARQIKNIIDAVELSQGIGSLETPIDENGELYIKDVIKDKTEKSPETIISALKLRDELDNVLSKLKDRERKIIELRYGVKNEKRATLEEIGKILKLSRERVRQLEKRGLHQLRWLAHKLKLI